MRWHVSPHAAPWDVMRFMSHFIGDLMKSPMSWLTV